MRANTLISPNDFASLFIAGCVFGAASARTNGGLVAPTTAHAVYNAGVLLEASMRSR